MTNLTQFHSDEAELRRSQFTRWLVGAWDWASDTGRPIADKIAELISHAEEPDYPLWELAAKAGVTGEGKIARNLRLVCGPYPDGPSLGWVNRNYDDAMLAKNFYLWSPAGNVVRFVMRAPIKESLDAVI